MRSPTSGFLAFALAASSAPLCAQAPAERVVVVCEHATPPRTRCHAVDPANGTVQPIAVHAAAGPWQADMPLALAVDPPTRDLILCTWSAASATTSVTRLRLGAAGIVADATLATLPAPAVAVTVQANGDVFVATEHPTLGGVHRIPRDGGPTTLAWSAPGITAMSDDTILPEKYWIAQDNPPNGPDLSVFLASAAGTPLQTYASQLPNGARVTGLHEHLNSSWWLRELVVADDLGRIWQGSSTLVSGLSEIPLATPIVPGGARRLKDAPGNGYWVLGGAADPTLKFLFESSAFANPPVGVVAVLPGDPVDFAWTGASTAATFRFGSPCGGAGAIGAIGTPQLGNQAFTVSLQSGLGSTFALLAGGDDALLQPVPVPPVGCALAFTPGATLLTATDPMGATSLPVPVPATPSLAGAIVFTQWWQLDANGALVGSTTLALHLWP